MKKLVSKSRNTSDPGLIPSPIVSPVERPITTQQLAAHLQVTTRTIASYRDQKLIPFWRINARRILYRLSDVERSLARDN
jgi:hypothetical protein